MRKIIAADFELNACMNDQVICTLKKKRSCFILSDKNDSIFYRIDQLSR